MLIKLEDPNDTDNIVLAECDSTTTLIELADTRGIDAVVGLECDVTEDNILIVSIELESLSDIGAIVVEGNAIAVLRELEGPRGEDALVATEGD